MPNEARRLTATSARFGIAASFLAATPYGFSFDRGVG